MNQTNLNDCDSGTKINEYCCFTCVSINRKELGISFRSVCLKSSKPFSEKMIRQEFLLELKENEPGTSLTLNDLLVVSFTPMTKEQAIQFSGNPGI